jgi:hypothetical protein
MHFYDWLGRRHSTTDPKYSRIPEPQILRHFIDEGYLPSATTILSVVRHPHLEQHKVKLALDHYSTHRNYEQALQFQDINPALKGTRLHNLCEQLFQNFIAENIFYIPDGANTEEITILSPLLQWAKAEVTQVRFTERSFLHFAAGYAGTADLLVETKSYGLLLADFKFRGQTRAFPLKPSIEYAAQLSAYRNYFQLEHTKPIAIANLLIDSFAKAPKTGGIPHLEIHSYRKDYTPFFQACQLIWKELNHSSASPI